MNLLGFDFNDIGMLIGGVGGFAGAFSWWHNWKFRKQVKTKEIASAKQSKSQANQDDITASDSAVDTIHKLNELINTFVEKNTELTRKVDQLSGTARQQNRQIAAHERQMKVVVAKFKIVTEILGEQIEHKQHAESHYCTVVECELREPPLSTYKTSNATNRMRELYEDLIKEKILTKDKDDEKTKHKYKDRSKKN